MAADLIKSMHDLIINWGSLSLQIRAALFIGARRYYKSERLSCYKLGQVTVI